MSGTIAEIQVVIQQIQLNLSQILSYQQQLWTRIESLENNASHQFTNLASQMKSIQSIRLTHSRESKAIEYNRPNPLAETNEE
jgi:flagellar capping protein FliD